MRALASLFHAGHAVAACPAISNIVLEIPPAFLAFFVFFFKCSDHECYLTSDDC